MTERIKDLLLERYKDICNVELRSCDEETKLKALTLVENTRQRTKRLSDMSKRKHVFSGEMLKIARQMNPRFDNNVTKKQKRLAALNVSNQQRFNKVWIELAKNKVFDHRCELYPLTVPGGIYVDGKKDHVLGVGVQRMMPAKFSVEPKSVARKIVRMLKRLKDTLPNNRIVFCPYELSITEHNDEPWSMLRYALENWPM